METLPIQPTTMWINISRKKTTGNWEKSQELHLDYHEEATTFGDDLYSIYVPGQGVTYPPWNQQLTCRPNHPPPKKKVFIQPKHQFFKGGQNLPFVSRGSFVHHLCRSIKQGRSHGTYLEGRKLIGMTFFIPGLGGFRLRRCVLLPSFFWESK